MKFQDSSFNGLKVTVGTKSVTHARTLQKQYAPSTFSKLGASKLNRNIRYYRIGVEHAFAELKE